MAKIKIIIEDDAGNVLNETPFEYTIDLLDDRFSTLEKAVDDFKKGSSKEVSKFLLSHQQTTFIKKKNT
jgi:hypothetical protein